LQWAAELEGKDQAKLGRRRKKVELPRSVIGLKARWSGSLSRIHSRKQERKVEWMEHAKEGRGG
jgi:hypothetical protein